MNSQLRPKGIAGWFRSLPLHTFLIAVYPTIGLLAVNLTEINTREIAKPLQYSLLIVAAVFILLRLLTRSWQLSGLLTSLSIVWFFSYGRLYELVKNFVLFGLIIGRHRYMIVLWSVIILGIAIWLVKHHRDHPNLTFSLNIISLVLVAIPVFQISLFHVRNLFYPKTPELSQGNKLISWTASSALPDIYYIVLDGYGRSDAIEKVVGYDNSAFITSLQQLGFYVAQCSQSNYLRTALSLTSTFNMEYLQTLNPQIKPNGSTAWLFPYLKHNLVRQQLEQLGYQTVVFKNPWGAMVWDDANIVYQPSASGVLSPFEYLFLSTTVAWVYMDGQQVASTHLAYYANYQDTLYALDRLQDVPNLPGPKLVFVHLVIPHPPYVFGPNGEYIDIQPYDTVNNLYTDADHRIGYSAAVTYIDKRMLEILPKLIQSSKTRPIIVLAGDHGFGEYDTVTQNLEAFYSPDAAAHFYANITPVNIFRVLFDSYFNGHFGLLADTSYISTQGMYFNFEEIPNTCVPR